MTQCRVRPWRKTATARWLVAFVCAFTPTAAIAASPAATETIVLVRHGEKPAQGLGQLDCQGLNRALALPPVIRQRFGRPAAVFAPNPSVQKDDDGHPYDYIRPLATIEPTAIAFGLPVDASIGVTDIDALRQKIEAPAYAGAFVLVAWEHTQIVNLARKIMAEHGGDSAGVPNWKGSDFDGIYVIRLTRTNDTISATFERSSEGLDGQPTTCRNG